MAPKKLSESDKQAILNRYRQSEETAASLANQYGVSTSTVSRLLKQSIPEEEYEILVQQKRSGARAAGSDEDDLPNLDAISAALAVVMKADRVAQEESEAEAPKPATEMPRQRSRSRSTLAQSALDSVSAPLPAPLVETQLEVPLTLQQVQEEIQTKPNGEEEEVAAMQPDSVLLSRSPSADLLDEELEDDLDDEDDDLDDLDDDLDDEDDDEDDDLSSDAAIEMVHVQGKGRVNVLPLSEAQIPRTCYVVIDRAAELITRPLKDFADLGQIPPEEVQEKTLPIFDNHRVAKRFLRRMQRIVKVPDGRMFQKVTPYLQAKGITRLLIDGQIYSI
jgi:transposase-like protein